MANLERIREVVEYVRVQERTNEQFHFNMGAWYGEYSPVGQLLAGDSFYRWKCGTNVCFAGAAALHAQVPLLKQKLPTNDNFISVTVDDGSEEGQSFESWAADYFELNEDQASEIFYSTEVHTIDELVDVIEEVLGVELFV